MKPDYTTGLNLLDQHYVIIAFKQFAESEMENVPDEKIEDKNVDARRQHVLKSNEFDYKLLEKQNELLAERRLDLQPPWFALNDYMDGLRSDYKARFVMKRIHINS